MALGAVAGDQQGVVPEELRDLLRVVGQVLVKGRPRRHSGLLQLDHHPRQAVDEANQIGPAGVEAADDAELADQQKVVLLRVFPIHHAQPHHRLPSPPGGGAGGEGLAIGNGDREAILEQPVDLAIGRLEAHRRTVAGDFVDGGLDRLGGQAGIEPGERGAQAVRQHDLALSLAAERGAGAEGLLHGRHRLPSERRKEPNGGLLDELVFGVGIKHGY